MMTSVKKKSKPPCEEFCISCECQLLTEPEKFGPMCKRCFQKTRRKDPLMQAAIRRMAVVLVPAICPHDDECKYDADPPRYFMILVLDENLEPRQFDGPYTERVAEREAKYIRERIERRKRRGKGK